MNATQQVIDCARIRIVLAQITEQRAYRILCEQRAKDCVRDDARASGAHGLLSRVSRMHR